MGLCRAVLLSKTGARQSDEVFWGHWGPEEAGPATAHKPWGLFVAWPPAPPCSGSVFSNPERWQSPRWSSEYV